MKALKKPLSLLLVLCMVAGMLCTTTFAAEGDDPSGESQPPEPVTTTIPVDLDGDGEPEADLTTETKNEQVKLEVDSQPTSSVSPGDDGVTNITGSVTIEDSNGNTITVTAPDAENTSSPANITVDNEDDTTPPQDSEDENGNGTDSVTSPEDNKDENGNGNGNGTDSVTPPEGNEDEGENDPDSNTSAKTAEQQAEDFVDAVNEALDKENYNQTVNADGSITTTADGTSTTYYPKDGTTVTTKGNITTTVTYKKDENGELLKGEDGKPVVDTTSTVVEGTDAESNTTTTTRQGNTTVVTVTDKDGNVISKTSTDGSGVTTTEKDGVTTTTSEDGTITTSTSDGSQTVTKKGGTTIIEVDGTKQSWNENGDIVEVKGGVTTSIKTDEAGVKTVTVEDADGNITVYTTIDGKQVRFTKPKDGDATAPEEFTGEVPTIVKLDNPLSGVTHNPLNEVTDVAPVKDYDQLILKDADEDGAVKEVTATEERSEDGNKVTTTVVTKKTEVKTDGDDAALVTTTETVTVTAEKVDTLKLSGEVLNALMAQVGNSRYAPYVDENGDIYIITRVVTTTVPGGDSSKAVTTVQEREAPTAEDLANAFTDMGQYSDEELLKIASNFTIFANDYTQNGHMDGNIMVGTFHDNGGGALLGDQGINGKYGNVDRNYDSLSYKDNNTMSYIGNVEGLFKVNPHNNQPKSYLVLGNEADKSKITIDASQGSPDDIIIANDRQKIEFTTNDGTGVLDRLAQYAVQLQGESAFHNYVQGEDQNNPTKIDENTTGLPNTSQEIQTKNNGTTYINISADALSGNNEIQVTLPQDGMVVFNVTDLTGMDSVDINKMFKVRESAEGAYNNGQYEFDYSKIMFNFGDYSGVINSKQVLNGIVLAPRATVNLTNSHTGTVIASSVTATNEMHKAPSIDPTPSPTPTPHTEIEVVKVHYEANRITNTLKLTPKAPEKPVVEPVDGVDELEPPTVTNIVPGEPSNSNPTPPPTPTPDPTPTPTPPTTDIPDEETPRTEPDPEPTPDVEIPDEEPPLADVPETPVEIPNEEPPLVDVPEEEPPLVEIPEEEPPLVDIPEEQPPVEIDEPDVPLADVPQTGDISLVWYAVFALSVCGLAVITLLKKREEQTL